MSHANELIVPPGAVGNADAREGLRLWAVGDGMEVSLAPSVWPQPAYWGIGLADVIRHLARAYQQAAGLDPDESASEILNMLLAEFGNPTDEPTGEYVS